LYWHSATPAPSDLPEEPGHRSVVEAITPDGDKCTLIVFRIGLGRHARVCVSFHGIRDTSAVLRPGDQAAALVEALELALKGRAATGAGSADVLG
jgi:hypothetical protein